MRSRSALILYGALLGTLALMLSWWIVFFVRQGTVLVDRANRAGAELSEVQMAAVREAARQSLRMFLFEGAFLFLAFLAGVILMLRAMRREILLARQQREFLSAVTHELRTPLASARLAIQSLALGRVGPEKQERYLSNAGADLARLSELVERVLESSRISGGRKHLELERLDLAELVGRRTGALAQEVAPELRIELDVHPPVPVEAEVAAVETILRNLLANAAKYAAEAGSVQVRARRQGQEACLAVRDFGPGVEGDPSTLFEPFQRGRGPLVKSRPGVGLGLYLVAELARALGGRIAARNVTEGGGFEVEVRLPVMAEKKMAEARERLLVVEDEAHLAEVIADNLEVEGWGVEVVTDGHRALERVRADPPALILLDVMLPGMDGFEVCETLRAEGCQVPVLFLTARNDNEDRVRGLELGGDDYLGKPFDLRELILRVHAILRRAQWFSAPSSAGERLRVGEAEVDFKAFTVRAGGRETRLSTKETMILRCLAERAGEVVARSEILDRVWGYDAFPTTRTIDNFIVRLRRLLEPDPGEPRYLHTIRGTGYRLTL